MALSNNLNQGIFREYIGSKENPGFDDFPDIIDKNITEFHFIIAFASDEPDEAGKSTGNFTPHWASPDINGEMIQKLKNKYKTETVNVKVVISIGGRGTKYPFNPAEKKKWLDKASYSLTKIITDLRDKAGNSMVDGIDINYDTITSDDAQLFSDCVGGLISSLRKTDPPLINVVSIAPSLSVNDHYQVLYKDYENDIDWVNYQFYTHPIKSKDEFEQLYLHLAEKPYARNKLLAGFSSDPSKQDKLSPEDFIKACTNLIKNGGLPGIFIWDANNSAPSFLQEKKAQELLTQK